MRCLFLILLGCADGGASPDPLEAEIDRLLGEMTLEEKVAEKSGIQLLPIEELYHTPSFRMVDGPRGVRAGVATAFPVGIARGATFDPALERRVGEAIGAEAKAKGANVILAPVVNVLRHPGWGRAQETYGEDPHHLGRMGVAFVEGAEQHVLASVKHFALNSIEDSRFEVNVTVDEKTLREVYLPAFKDVVDAGVGSVMSAYNKVNGVYCGENRPLLFDILKEEWGFDGFVESDWVFGTRSTIDAANNGLDIEMPAPTFFGAELLEALRTGHVKEATIDASVRRILRKKLTLPESEVGDVVESDAHRALAKEVAVRSIVLLKNEDALPLDTALDVAVIGPLADVTNIGDEGSSAVTPSSVVTPLDGLSAIGNVTLVETASMTAGMDAAIVVVGLTSEDEGENIVGISGGDRTSLGLDAEEEQLIRDVAASNPRTIVLLEGGSAITMPWVDDVEAVVMAWYPGMEGGHAIAEILYGIENPSGRLPLAFPVAEADLVPFDPTADEVTYGYWHGQRHLDREGTQALFPFGHGLSYTTFAYDNLTVEGLTVTADITNTGDRPGTEIAMLYVEKDEPKKLVGFTPVSLDPGETKTVTFEVEERSLARWIDGSWSVEPGAYTLELGGLTSRLDR